MKMVVQKFGGTSVATEASRLAVVRKISKALEENEQPIVVVSAIGRLGAPYATDTLLQFVHDNAGEMEDRESDLLLACGEIISAVTMTTLLKKYDIKAKAFTGGQAGIITNNDFTQAELLYTEPEKILECIKDGCIPVIAGFQGITTDGQITTIGRGGSDTTASMIGSSIKADRIEIYTDVDGIMTADPRVCDKVHIIPALSYSEIFQMADSGAKVIHPRAVEYAMRANIPLVIKNTFTEAEGTFILQNVNSILNTNDTQSISQDSLITGVAHRPNRVQYIVDDTIFNELDLLELLGKMSINIDMLNIFPNSKMFTIDTNDQSKLEALLAKYNYQFTKIAGCAKITIIGERMTGVTGVMARVVRTLTKHNIHILQTGDSLTTISLLIQDDEISKAVCSLHEEFDI